MGRTHLNRRFQVVEYLVTHEGYTRAEAIKAWSKDIYPQINIDMGSKEIIAPIKEYFDELETKGK